MRDKEAEKIVYKVAKRLAELRDKSGLSLEGVSHLTGLSISTLSDMENQKSFPGTLTIVKVCRALDIKPSQIFEDIGC